MSNTLDRQINIRVYHDGRIVVGIFAPALLGMERTIAGGHAVFSSGAAWMHALKLIERAIASWTEQGSTYAVHIRHQGAPIYDREA